MPLERGADLEPHASALRGEPLALASRLAGEVADETGLRQLSRGPWRRPSYLARAIRDYRREARAGRVPFAVDELLAAGVDNDGSRRRSAAGASRGLSGRTARHAPRSYFETAAQALPRAAARPQRHLLVLAALGLKHLQRQCAGRAAGADYRICCSPGRRRGAPINEFGARNDSQTIHARRPTCWPGRVILITGAGSGLGRALAIECARAGASVILSRPQRRQARARLR